MVDMICRKTMQRCLTPGMCSPHGGCQPELPRREVKSPLTETIKKEMDKAAHAAVHIALWVLERHEWNWRMLNPGAFMMRKKNAAKAAALIAHDRILNYEIVDRGVPTHYNAN